MGGVEPEGYQEDRDEESEEEVHDDCFCTMFEVTENIHDYNEGRT